VSSRRPKVMRIARLAPPLLVLGVLVSCSSTDEGTLDAGVPPTAPSTDPAPTTSLAAEPAPDPAPESDDALGFGLAACGETSVVLSAGPSWYRDEPVYVANEQPVEEVRAWAEGQPGYEGIWIDREHRGWLSVGFTSDVEARQEDLLAEFPDVGVVAVEVPAGRDELAALQTEVGEVAKAAGFDVSSSGDVPYGRVEVWAPVLDDSHLAPFAAFADRPVCFTGPSASEVVPDGPQTESGDGWRLLGEPMPGPPYRTGVATTDEQYGALWERAGRIDERPNVDFTTEIVVWFGAVYGSTCPIRMDDVVVDRARALVHGDFVVPGSPQLCTADANGKGYLVALERERLPVGPFAVQLTANDPAYGVPEERTLVTVDLSAPGAVATDAQLTEDPALHARTGRGYVIEDGGTIEPGVEVSYAADVECFDGMIGPINGIVWASIDGFDARPAAWTDFDDAGRAIVRILMQDGPPTVTLSAGGHVEVFQPAPSEVVRTCP
jgi:hypothetical protein